MITWINLNNDLNERLNYPSEPGLRRGRQNNTNKSLFNLFIYFFFVEKFQTVVQNAITCSASTLKERPEWRARRRFQLFRRPFHNWRSSSLSHQLSTWAKKKEAEDVEETDAPAQSQRLFFSLANANFETERRRRRKKKPIDFGFFLHFSHKKIQLHFNTLLLIDDFDDFDSFTMEKCSSDSIGSSQTFKAESKSPSILCKVLSNWSRSWKWHGNNRFGNHSSGFTDSSYSNYNTFVGWIQPDRNCFSFV